MSCCGSSGVFRKKDNSIDVDAVKKTIFDSSNFITTEKQFSYSSTIDAQKQKPNYSFSREEIKEDLPLCNHRSFVGTTRIGSQSIISYRCNLYKLSINARHCFECKSTEKSSG